MQKNGKNEFIAVGLMLFALFFGAGNLIFPAFLGQNAGWNMPWAIVGFLITGVGIPLASVLAICFSGSDLRTLASRVHPVYGLVFSALLYLTIGPCFAIPRTATVSFEIAVTPFLADGVKDVALPIFVFVFFLLSWWLAITPTKLVTRIGKCITPLLLLFLFILIGSAVISPMGAAQEPVAAYSTAETAFSSALVEGYNTMDCLAGLVFGVIVVETIKMFGVTSERAITKTALRSGIISTFFMALIYGALVYLGATSVSVLGHLDNGAPVLVGASHFYFGHAGNAILGAAVILACLTTSIGLIASCAAFFNTLIPRFSHKAWATFFAIISFGIALFGLSAIIKGAIPMLLFLYPLAIALIVLTFASPLFGGRRVVYASATLFTFFPAAFDALKTLGVSIPAVEKAMEQLPLASYSMEWIPFFLVGFLVGLALKKLSRAEETVTE